MKGRFTLLFILSLVVAAVAVSAAPGVWWGFVKITNSSGNNLSAEAGTVVDVYVNGIWKSNTTAYMGPFPGYYVATASGNTGDSVTFRIWGSAPDNTTAEVWTEGLHPGSDYGQWFNLTFTAIANSAACNHSKACTGGYCCSGATEIRQAAPYSGTAGTCQASACSASSSSSSSGGSSGGGSSSSSSSSSSTSSGGGGGSAAVTETSTVPGTVSADSTATFSFAKAADTGIATIEVTTSSTAAAVTGPQITVRETTLAAGSPTAGVSASGGSGVAPKANQEVVFQYLTITKANIQDADIKSAKVKFQVAKSWVSQNSIDHTTVSLKRLVGSAWTKQPTKFVKEDANYYHYEAEVPGFSTFAITGEQKAAPTTAFGIIDTIRGFYAGKSSYTAFDIIDIIRKFYSGG